MMILLPRLPDIATDYLLSNLFSNGQFDWLGFDPRALPDEVRYASTGGSIVTPTRLNEIREDIVEIAGKYGFSKTADRNFLSQFDAALGEYLTLIPELSTGEGLRNDVWAFITIVLAPDVVFWRFGYTPERYKGGIRNAFQRLWHRGKVLDRGSADANRWGLLHNLTEDALVQITERPSIGADPVLARALAEAWVRASGSFGRGLMEGVMRLVSLRLRIRNEVRALTWLPEEELAAFLDAEFKRAAVVVARKKGAGWSVSEHHY